jgi:hypothetical protein
VLAENLECFGWLKVAPRSTNYTFCVCDGANFITDYEDLLKEKALVVPTDQSRQKVNLVKRLDRSRR